MVVAARTGFLTAVTTASLPWQQVAMQLNMTAKSIDLVDLGAAPMPKESRVGGITIQDHIEKTKTVTPKDWDLTVWISQNTIDDDQTGSLERKVRGAGMRFQQHINKRVFTVLNGGDGTTYGLCYDGQEFFDSDHVDKGADYTTNQDNEATLALSLDNFETSWKAAQVFRDDQGEFTEYNYDQLVCHPDNLRIAKNIVENTSSYDTADREDNPYSGMLKPVITSPHLDSAAWYIIASSESVKPLILCMRKQPGLQSAWFDPKQPEGGRWYFKFYGRYEVHYGDWRLAYQGQT
jgi:phage major head subunit gpT-like protein